MTTIMQPFQCNLQPQIQETHRTTHTHTQPPVAEHRGGTDRVWNDRSRNRRTHEVRSPAATTLHGKNASFRAPTSSPKQSPLSIHAAIAAIAMPFAASRGQPASLYAHGNTRWQQSCGHATAICNHRFKKRIELRTRTQPLSQNTEEEQIRDRNDRSRNHRTHEVPSPAATTLHGKNASFRAPASSPKQSPLSIHAATTMRFAASRG